MIGRLRGQSGQATVELVGMLWWILLAGLAVWQLLLITWTFTQASNAARTASRVEARGGDAVKAATNALQPILRHKLVVRLASDQETVTVKVRIPIFAPGLSLDNVRATGTARLPS